MKKVSIVTLGLLLAAMIPAIQRVYAATQGVDGVISDTMCGRKHMLQGKTPAQCIEQCTKEKAGYALVTKSKVYTLVGESQTIAPFAGKQVHVDGTIKDSTITVTAVHDMKADMPAGMPM